MCDSYWQRSQGADPYGSIGTSRGVFRELESTCQKTFAVLSLTDLTYNPQASAIRARNAWLNLGLSEEEIEQLAGPISANPQSSPRKRATTAKASDSKPPVQASTYAPASNSAWTAVNTKPEKSLGGNMEDVQIEETLPSTTQRRT
jgi:hypothetical protein